MIAAAFGSGAPPIGAGEYVSGIEWPTPTVVQAGDTDRSPPSDAIVLFDGDDRDAWRGAEKWTVENGHLICGEGHITSHKRFGDCQVHLEWSAPPPGKRTGQSRGNSGLFFFGIGSYEIQILDSHDSETYPDGQAGAVYKQTPPMVNVCRPPGQWNTYDVFWKAPKFDEQRRLVTPAYITAVHNGVLIHHHTELLGDTPYVRPPAYRYKGERGPIGLQDHGSKVRFRNIWVREIVPQKGKRTRQAFLRENGTEIEIPTDTPESDATPTGATR